MQAMIEELREKGELPIFYHEAPVSKVIKDHPDRKKLNRQILMEISQHLPKYFRKANTQIRDTKAAFNLPAAKGFIILTNSELPEMTPELAWNELWRLLNKKSDDAWAYDHIGFAVYFQDVEVIEAANNVVNEPAFVISREEDPQIVAFSNTLLRAVAEAKGLRLVKFDGDSQQVLKSTIPHKRFKATQSRLTRSELWRSNYLQNRTYHDLTDEELVHELARFTLEEFLTINNGKIAQNTATHLRDYIGQKVEELHTECELRFVDMRKVAAQMDFLLAQGRVRGSVADFLRRKRDERTDGLGS